jgi:predicted transglutaminase-like cysteine proteinase
MFNEFSLRNISKVLFILFVACQISATAIADPAATARTQSAEERKRAGFAARTLPQSPDEPFGLSAAAAQEFAVLRRSVDTGIRFDHGTLVRCQANEDCPPAAQLILQIVAQGDELTGRAQIGVINRAINFAIRPAKDKAEMSASDSWDSPLHSLAAGQGDCKNYAVAKYLALLEVGISAADIRLVIVRDRLVDQNHVVVTVRLDQHWLVLDNRWLALAEDIELPRFEPLSVLELDGIEQHPAALVTLRAPLHFPLPQRD